MKYLRPTIFIFLLTAVAVPASANMIWPSIYIVAQYYTWYVIAIGLLIEFFATRYFLKADWKKCALITLAMNTISALIGLLLIPASGIFIEIITLPFGGGTFQLSHWILDYIAAVLSNVVIEGLSIKWIFKYSFKRNFLWLLAANAITVVVSLLIPAITYFKTQ